MAPTQLGQLAELETDLAFQQGRYDEAELEMRKSYSHGKGVRPGARLALAIAPLGASAEAREILAEIEAKLSGGDPVFRAWVQLQRGLLELESGRPEKALPHYRRADETLAGWWLVEEHIAEALAQTGELEEARKIYERVVADTGHPELMYALAGVLADLGDQEQAARWTREARQQFEVRLAMFPEAAAGHALEFFLEEDGDGARSLELAETNFRLRPNGAANNFLARAYLKVGRVEDAVNTAEAARASGWKTARLLATLTRALAAADRSEDAEAAKQEALAVNPRVFD